MEHTNKANDVVTIDMMNLMSGLVHILNEEVEPKGESLGDFLRYAKQKIGRDKFYGIAMHVLNDYRQSEEDNLSTMESRLAYVQAIDNISDGDDLWDDINYKFMYLVSEEHSYYTPKGRYKYRPTDVVMETNEETIKIMQDIQNGTAPKSDKESVEMSKDWYFGIDADGDDYVRIGGNVYMKASKTLENMDEMFPEDAEYIEFSKDMSKEEKEKLFSGLFDI